MVRILDDYEVTEEELYNHIGIFLENNANLIRSGEGDGEGGGDSENNNNEGGLDDSRTDLNQSNQRTTNNNAKNHRGGSNKAAQQIKIRDHQAVGGMITPGALTKKAKKSGNHLSGATLAGEPIRKVKKG